LRKASKFISILVVSSFALVSAFTLLFHVQKHSLQMASNSEPGGLSIHITNSEPGGLAPDGNSEPGGL
jgi:hypothetical protein